MGEDLLLTFVWSYTETADFDAIEKAIAALPDETIQGQDDYENVFAEGEESKYREQLRDDLKTLRDVWEGRDNRMAFAGTLGVVHYAVTGGGSWGDSPTEEFDSWNRLRDVGVLEAGGFYDESNAIRIPLPNIKEDH